MRTVIFGVSVRRLQTDMSEPAADDIHLDAGLKEMDRRRVPKHVRRNPTRRRCRRGVKVGGMLPHAFVDPKRVSGRPGADVRHRSILSRLT